MVMMMLRYKLSALAAVLAVGCSGGDNNDNNATPDMGSMTEDMGSNSNSMTKMNLK